jgi:hypothetical protein
VGTIDYLVVKVPSPLVCPASPVLEPVRAQCQRCGRAAGPARLLGGRLISGGLLDCGVWLLRIDAEGVRVTQVLGPAVWSTSGGSGLICVRGV